ncbi:NAD-dependent epimerase/dehydratase family protein [Poriferisphaera sp. WC338]|uniref:NAD-dependent epimerase/dehydratase family protein n=1 Tax=Poriferisphaera sp. WC338 TaxID=3425129 RepID=UPI003D8152B7
MKILFTGASSFTGCWFVKQLLDHGHDVVAVYQRSRDSYKGLRDQRIRLIEDRATCIYECSYGSDVFLELVKSEKRWDLLAHHAADVTDYHSDEFDIARAVGRNTLNTMTIMKLLRERECDRVLLTGSVFEQNEGAGSEGGCAFSPYGLSKGITSEMFHYYGDMLGMVIGKFVIPNPFGPLEEPRFTNYLMKTWSSGDVPGVRTPDYVRDNIHVSLLAGIYAKFTKDLPYAQGHRKINPSGYVETQGAFALRFAKEMRSRLNHDCKVDLCTQTEFAEPRVRINLDPVSGQVAEWDESAAWDAIAAYYADVYPNLGS